MTPPTEERFAEKTTPHLRRLAETSDAIRRMYRFDPEHEDLPARTDVDLFLEKELTRTKGVVYKYPGRAIVLLSYTCAANCRYCERQDRVGVGLDAEGRMTNDEIDRAVRFVAEDDEITEVIFSGGDPLTHPLGLERAWAGMAALSHVKVLRVHTRLPMQAPEKTDLTLLGRLTDHAATPYLSLHVDHPDELTADVESVIHRLRRLGYLLISQSVFLRGVNDNVDTLARMFTRLAELGVRPYYLYHCHPIPTTRRFVMPLEDEIALMSRLRERVSGIACPQHIFEMRGTTGKLCVPSDHWDVDLARVRDFNLAEFDTRAVAEDIAIPSPLHPPQEKPS